MTTPTEERSGQTYRCPVCDAKLAAETAAPTHNASCAECGYSLWCRKKNVNGVAVLDILPDSVPEPTDVERVVESLVGSKRVPHVLVDLSRLEFVNSSFLARLLLLKNRIRHDNGRLILYGLRGLVRDTLASTKLDTILEIADDEKDALASL
jgi:anti-anti-sigma factor